MKSRIAIVLALISGLWAGPIVADKRAPYAGEQTREIKSLSPVEIDGLLAGKGMGYAKAAELNGYPGPAHVLELSKALSLTAEQLQKTEAIFAQMEAAAKNLGAELVAAEHALDQAFKNKAMDAAKLSALVSDIGQIEARLRVIHLNAHLQQTAVLNDQQIAQYQVLRGYDHTGHNKHHMHHH